MSCFVFVELLTYICVYADDRLSVGGNFGGRHEKSTVSARSEHTIGPVNVLVCIRLALHNTCLEFILTERFEHLLQRVIVRIVMFDETLEVGATLF